MEGPAGRLVDPSTSRLLALGVGNVLLRDEGVGVRVARELQALGPDALPADAVAVDGGTLGFDLLPMLADTRALVLIDAVDLRIGPGTVRVLRDEELQGALAPAASPHEVGVADLLAAARLAGALPERVSMVAVEPGRIEIGLELTPEVEAAVQTAVELVRRELIAFAEPVPGSDRTHETVPVRGRPRV